MASIHWRQPVEIDCTDGISFDHVERLINEPGVYFFSRCFGEGSYEPFYIGKSANISTRLSQYVSSSGVHEKRIRNVLEGGLDKYSQVRLKNGARYFHFGYVTPMQGQNMEIALDRAERALIQFAKIVGWRIINNHHAGRAAFHTFEMSGSHYGGLLPGQLIAHKAPKRSRNSN